MTKSIGSLEQLVMFATAKLGDGAHGAAIRAEVADATGRVVSHGALYATMERLERLALVESWIGEETPVGGGRRRRFYRLSSAGARALREGYEGLQRLADDTLSTLAAIEGRVG